MWRTSQSIGSSVRRASPIYQARTGPNSECRAGRGLSKRKTCPEPCRCVALACPKRASIHTVNIAATIAVRYSIASARKQCLSSTGGEWHQYVRMRRKRGISTKSENARTVEGNGSIISHRHPAAQSDNAALLRRMASYIEEDRGAADRLGEAIGQSTGHRLSAVLGQMEYAVREPSARDLRRVAFINAVPFVGFGVMDNAIMVVAGEYIDFTFGVFMGFSTMAAAALGNTISDVAGVGLGGFIESMARKLGLPPLKLSRAQMQLRTTRLASLLGSALGVTVGCLIGMFPLLLMPDAEVVEASKRKEKTVGLIDAVVLEATSFLNATNATLYILDKEQAVLWARRRGQPGTEDADAVQDVKLHLQDRSPVSNAARTGMAVSLRRGTKGVGPSMLCMPVFGADGQVAAVVQVVGKRSSDDREADRGFTKDDERELCALCSHISVALENIKRADEADEVDLRETIALMKTHGGIKEPHSFPQRRSTNTRVSPISATNTHTANVTFDGGSPKSAGNGRL